MSSAGGEFAYGVRYGASDAVGADSTEHPHFPYARRLRLDWSQDSDGRWTSGQEDSRLWEVFCAECGDTDGPAEHQSELIQKVRGPYASERKARQTAKKHFEEN